MEGLSTLCLASASLVVSATQAFAATIFTLQHWIGSGNNRLQSPLEYQIASDNSMNS